jgi:hypothetical protein
MTDVVSAALHFSSNPQACMQDMHWWTEPLPEGFEDLPEMLRNSATKKKQDLLVHPEKITEELDDFFKGKMSRPLEPHFV